MEKIIFIIILLIFAKSKGYTQSDNTVVITTIGSGSSYESAKVNALRSALEQVSGAYLTANTLIINDKLISDNISTITTGSINKYEVLGQIVSNNQFFVTIKSEILPNKFAAFVSGKTGSSVTVKGGLYAANIKQLNLNEKAELESVKRLSDLYSSLLFESIYFDVKPGSPVEANKIKKYNPIQYYILPLDVKIRFTPLSDSANKYLKVNLKKISLLESEIRILKEIPREIYTLCIDNEIFSFRNKNSSEEILKYEKEKTEIDYLNSFSIEIDEVKYKRYVKKGRNGNFYTHPEDADISSLVLISNFTKKQHIYTNYEYNILKGFNRRFLDCRLELTNYIDILCDVNYAKYKIEEHNCLLLWNSDNDRNVILDGYFTLSELENISSIKIIKEGTPVIPFLKIVQKNTK